MNKIEYQNYLNSKEWLLKKNEFINIHLKNNWNIECSICKLTDSLQVHHLSYRNIGNEILTDDSINELVFLCRDCHKKWHKEKGFKEKIEKIQFENFFNKIKSYGTKTNV